ncbi:hypothetical protein LCGC14_2686450, partial [marine sediment metagenome]
TSAIFIDTSQNVIVTSLTASEIVITDASKNLISAAVATYPSLAELIHVKDVTSALQTQIDGKQPLDSELTTIAALTETNGNVMFVAGGAWTSDATPAINCTDCTNVGGAEDGTWSDVSGSRVIDTVYQNTGGDKMRVSMTISAASGERLYSKLEVGSANPPTLTAGTCRAEGVGSGNDPKCQLYTEVPDDWYYRLVSVSGTPVIDAWIELNE